MLLALENQTSDAALVTITWGTALLSLAVVLSQVWSRWHFRRQVWLTEPERLLEPHTPAAVLMNFAVLLSIAAAITALCSPARWHLPLAVWMAAFGAFGAAHLCWHPLRGAVGVGVLMVMFIKLGDAWLWSSGYLGEFLGALLGLGLARWLARFWEQQLDQGQPWTTAGRLIPVCRRISLVMLVVVLVLAGLAFWPSSEAVPAA